jgi:hypothetical protein
MESVIGAPIVTDRAGHRVNEWVGHTKGDNSMFCHPTTRASAGGHALKETRLHG